MDRTPDSAGRANERHRDNPTPAVDPMVEAIVAAVQDAVVVLRPDGTILIANPALEEMLGYERGELIGASAGLLFADEPSTFDSRLAANPVDTKPLRSSGLDDILEHGRLDDVMSWWNRKDGSRLPMLLNAGVARTSEGKLIGIVCTAKNVADQQKAVRSIAKERDAAQRASALRQRYMATFSHDIKNILFAVGGYATMLGDTALDDEQRRFIEVIERSTRALTSLLTGMLDVSRMESGRLSLAPRLMSIEAFSEEILDLTRDSASQKKLDLALRISSRVPDLLILDFDRLRQVLLNLVGNAIKYTPTGFVQIRIERAASESASNVDAPIPASASEATPTDGTPMPENAFPLRIVVRDSGPGIPDEHVSRVFHPFERLAEAKTIEGVGLGLAICREWTELMRGRIHVESGLGRGTTFMVDIPAEVPSRDALEVASSATLAVTTTTPPDLSGRSIYLVGPEGATVRTVGQTLAGWGADVRVKPVMPTGGSLARSTDVIITGPGVDPASLRPIAMLGMPRIWRLSRLSELDTTTDPLATIPGITPIDCPVYPSHLRRLMRSVVSTSSSSGGSTEHGKGKR